MDYEHFMTKALAQARQALADAPGVVLEVKEKDGEDSLWLTEMEESD